MLPTRYLGVCRQLPCVFQSLVPQSSAESAAAVRIGQMYSQSMIRSNGTWIDLNYTERKRAGWPLLKHLNRITSISAAWACPICTTHHDPLLLSSALLGLRYWLRTDPIDPNVRATVTSFYQYSVLALSKPLLPNKLAVAYSGIRWILPRRAKSARRRCCCVVSSQHMTLLR